MNKYFLISYGCQMNDHDSEFIEGILISMGMGSSKSEEDADIIVINTCCVRRHAEERAIGRITQLNKLKSKNKNLIICVAGCIAQQEGENLIEKMPFIDIVIGTRDLPNLSFAINEVDKTRKKLILTDGIESSPNFDLPIYRPSKIKALATIMTGCNNFCSYCVVPYVRGSEISRPSKEIINEIKKLADEGVKEVLLIGQNVNSYRDGNIDFPTLLYKIDSITGIKRIRFITSHPKDASDSLFQSITSLKSVCEHLHLPAQAGNNRILELMNRGYTQEEYLEKIGRLRSLVPDIAITTDLMVGFPTETNQEFEDTINLTLKSQWDLAFMFIYSIRAGTEAAKLPDDVPRDEKIRRIQELIHIQEGIANQKNKKLIGSIQEVLVEGVSRRSQKDLIGRTRTDKTVIFEGKENLINTFASVKITETSSHTLKGILVE